MSGRVPLAMVLLTALIGSASAGCAGWRQNLSSSDVAYERKQREAQAVEAFEAHRDSAQLQAALDRWSQGDIAGCEARLRALAARHPNDTDVRMRLAEVLWSREAAGEAEAELRQVLAEQPGLAEAHHLLGMILAEQARLGDARSHLARARELDPACEVYRATYESLPESSAPF